MEMFNKGQLEKLSFPAAPPVKLVRVYTHTEASNGEEGLFNEDKNEMLATDTMT
jgi:hypothetical protein